MYETIQVLIYKAESVDDPQAAEYVGNLFVLLLFELISLSWMLYFQKRIEHLFMKIIANVEAAMAAYQTLDPSLLSANIAMTQINSDLLQISLQWQSDR